MYVLAPPRPRPHQARPAHRVTVSTNIPGFAEHLKQAGYEVTEMAAEPREVKTGTQKREEQRAAEPPKKPDRKPQ